MAVFLIKYKGECPALSTGRTGVVGLTLALSQPQAGYGAHMYARRHLWQRDVLGTQNVWPHPKGV